jgi:formylglycine-generating enzyme
MRCYLSAVLLLSMMLLSGCASLGGSSQKRTAPAVPTDIEMVFIKGGCFQMGDTFGSGRSDEMPAHEICLDDYSIGTYEVTQAQWLAVMGNNPASNKACGPDCPVENVSWDDVKVFIKQLNSMTGKNYRLPWEAEWEYAARSGGKTELWAGTSDEAKLGDYVWFVDNSGEKTHPVGKKKPNGLGMYDMTGNVWEWCQDLHGDNYYKNSPAKNPQGPVRGQSRITRGGSWGSKSWELRATARGRIYPKNKNASLGFRLVLSKAQ